MKPAARRAFGTPPASGDRYETRGALALAATLHADDAEPCAVTVADVSSQGCRAIVASMLSVGTHVAVILDTRTLVSGRVAWNDGTALGVDFCAPLLPRIVARLQSGASS